MVLVAVVWVGLVGSVGQDPAPGGSPDLAAEYRQARQSGGHAPADQVRLALWCEAHGLTAERVRHLALAVLADPGNATARGLLGLVRRDGRWVAPEAVAESVRADADHAAVLAEYDARRGRTAYTADAQWALGVWADEHGLADQARAHFTVVVRLDPSREAAWKRLGYKKHAGGWATDTQIAASKAEAEAQKGADKLWRTRFERWKTQLDQPAHRDEARAALREVADPRAVGTLVRVFGTDRADDQVIAVATLGQIVAPQATRALAVLAVSSRFAEVRRGAVETLRQRDPRDFVGLLVGMIRTPIRYDVQPVGGPGQPGSLTIRGDKANTQRVYRPMNAPNLAGLNLSNTTLGTDPDGLPILQIATGQPFRDNGQRFTREQLGFKDQNARIDGLRDQLVAASANSNALAAFDRVAANAPSSDQAIQRWTNEFIGTRGRALDSYNPIVQSNINIPIGAMMRDAQNSALTAQQQLDRDAAALDQANAAIRRANEPVLSALGATTGVTLGDDAEAWGKWWTDQRGYALPDDSSTTANPTFVQDIPVSYAPTAAPFASGAVVGYAIRTQHSCFAAGTAVRTIDGTRAIETIRRGDQVLVQDTRTGSLSFQPVLNAFHNPPSGTLRIKLGDDEVVATGIHRFWRAGHGWAMARDLKPGDSLRVLGGVASVTAVEVVGTQPVFNLEVAEGRSFFVGRLGALVHDNSLVEATPEPFDGLATADR